MTLTHSRTAGFSRPVFLGVLLFGLSSPALPQSYNEEVIEEIIVVGARLPRPANEIVGKVDVITHEKLTSELATSLSDVTRYIPGVSVYTADSRFGETELTIRGLGGNRVATFIDSVPLPDQFDVGSFANAGQDFLVSDAVSRIEILRGPASTLFGNDALGGVVAVVTRDPQEYLGNKNFHLGGTANYSSRDDSTILTGSVGTGGDTATGHTAGLLYLSRSDGHEVQRSATDNPDEQDRTRKSLFSKLHHTLASGNRLTLDFSAFEEDVTTDVESVLGYGRKFRNTTSLIGEDTRERYAVTAGYEFESNSAWLDSGQVKAFWQQVEVDQLTTEIRAPLNTLNERSFSYDTETIGAVVDLDSSFSTGSVDHRIGWGASVQRASITEERGGLTTNLLTGESSNAILGEVFPVRDFPKSTVDEIAIYVHDEIAFGDFMLVPGLRYQTYDLDARADSIYNEDNPATDIVDVRESALAPKLGLLWSVSPETQLYAQYAHGFRAPPFEDVNIGFNIPLFNYSAIPNPDLKAETSDGIELGFRLNKENYRLGFAIYGVDYDNLIETKVNLGPQPPDDALTFQSRNIDQARVYGAEVNFNTNLDRWVRGLSFDAAASISRGDNRTNDQPLNTIDPPELIAAFTWQPVEQTRFAFITTAVGDQGRVDRTSSDIVDVDGYVLFDLTASYRWNNGLRVDAGVFNLADTTYWRWSSVRNRTVGDPMIDHLSAPGRYYSVSVRMEL